RLGLAALKLIAGTNIAADLKSIEISFKLAPRLNAAGRIEQADSALKLLRAKQQSEARQLAEHLDALNCTRRSEEEKILAEARIEALHQMEHNQASLVLLGEHWHPGIIGIVASRLVEEFGRPAIVLCKHKAVYRGSGRSVGDLDLHELLTKVAGYLLSFGGHKAAAALSLEPCQLENFRQAFDQEVAKVAPKKPISKILIDGELALPQAFCAETLDEIALLEPFGQGNPEPIFVTPPVWVDRHDYLGYDHKNILLTVRDQDSALRMQAKGWRMANLFPPPSLAGKSIRLAYVLRLNMFRGIPQPELDIKDIHLTET
ncbi:MAG: single-stranded-DNA-specific exonuclease RecJ, partial [Desulfovibrionaceae bacterium]|nr:single-stranded-DNA-specific exonuclease RecJ [Desulfovibrionaceae bacterium]